MSDQPSNEALAVMIQNLDNNLQNHARMHAEGLARIETKVDHTNGRVRKLEQWKFAMMGGLILGNLIVVPIIVSFITKIVIGALSN